MIAQALGLGGKSELRRVEWFVTRTSGDRWKVPQKANRLASTR